MIKEVSSKPPNNTCAKSYTIYTVFSNPTLKVTQCPKWYAFLVFWKELKNLFDHLTSNIGWCCTLKTGLKPVHFFQRVLLAVNGAGGTISESSTFLHERVRRANARMSRNKSKYGYKYASKSMCGWFTVFWHLKRVKRQHITRCMMRRCLRWLIKSSKEDDDLKPASL